MIDEHSHPGKRFSLFGMKRINHHFAVAFFLLFPYLVFVLSLLLCFLSLSIFFSFLSSSQFSIGWLVVDVFIVPVEIYSQQQIVQMSLVSFLIQFN